jgi:hypothetical protein
MVEDMVLVDRLEVLEELEPEAMRPKYAPIPATAIMTTTMTTTAVRATPSLSCDKKSDLQDTVFSTGQPLPNVAII